MPERVVITFQLQKATGARYCDSPVDRGSSEYKENCYALRGIEDEAHANAIVKALGHIGSKGYLDGPLGSGPRSFYTVFVKPDITSGQIKMLKTALGKDLTRE